jgi:hypothetical protein
VHVHLGHMYRELDPRHIVATADALGRRIGERFPDSGLLRVSQELLAVAVATEPRVERLRQPHWPIRTAASAALFVILAIVAAVVVSVKVRTDITGWADFFQGLDAAVNDLVFIGIAIFFLVTAENRLKRRRALRALQELRSIAHIIDLHQLTKDPEYVRSPELSTASSPPRVMSRFELARYLDYCSESLSVTSKLAALYVQCFNDPVVLSAVNDIESLTQGLSVKIWQKIMILDLISAGAEPRTS